MNIERSLHFRPRWYNNSTAVRVSFVGIRIPDTRCTADIVGQKEQFNVKTTTATRCQQGGLTGIKPCALYPGELRVSIHVLPLRRVAQQTIY